MEDDLPQNFMDDDSFFLLSSSGPSTTLLSACSATKDRQSANNMAHPQTQAWYDEWILTLGLCGREVETWEEILWSSSVAIDGYGELFINLLMLEGMGSKGLWKVGSFSYTP